MSLSPQLPAQTLPEWLDIATRDLVPLAQDRIRAEIEAHYAEAVALHLENGLPEPAAAAAALADLGDAYAAARRFGRECMTKNDAEFLAKLLKSDRSTLAFPGICLCAATIVSHYHILGLPTFRLGVLLFLIIALIMIRIAVLIQVRRKTAPAILRRIVLFDALSILILGAVVSVSARDGFPEIFWPVISAHIAFAHFRLRKKLASVGEDWNEPLNRDAKTA